MSKSFRVLAGILTVMAFWRGADAANFTCPAPSQIDCVPAKKLVGGWRDNHSVATGNAFAPNDQCANVVSLPSGKIRLLCCYTKCGVFLRDVVAKSCTKPSQSEFVCQ